MSKEHNHVCKICGESYYACDNCPEVKDFAPWRVLCDTQEHYRVFLILNMFKNEIISKVEAKEQLLELGVNHKYAQELPKFIKDILLDILNVKNK